MSSASDKLVTTAPKVEFVHVSGISWPRSGHHLLVRLLTGYFGPDFVYCEFHSGNPTNPDLGACCRTAPCKNASRIALTKNHDFERDTPQIDGHKYIVQCRDYLPSTVSNYELAVRSGLADNATAFRTFVSKQFKDYLSFTAKWVTSPFARHENVLQLPYEDLVAAPEVSLALAIRHITVGHVPDEDRIRAVVAAVDGQKVADKKVHILEASGVHNARRVENFRFYNPNLFDAIKTMMLTRDEVFGCFHEILGRDPGEGNMIHFQNYASVDILTAHLKKTSEYKKRIQMSDSQTSDR